MRERARNSLVTLPLDAPIWERAFAVNPLVLIGSKEGNGNYNLAPKHMAMPMGWENYFGVVCTPRERRIQARRGRFADLPGHRRRRSVHRGCLPVSRVRARADRRRLRGEQPDRV